MVSDRRAPPQTGWGKRVGHDDDMIQANSLRDEWSVDSWTAGDRYGTSCVQLDNFDWVMRCLWPSLWSLRRDHGLAGARTYPCWWTGGGSPSLRMVQT